jgi:gas vesicle protein
MNKFVIGLLVGFGLGIAVGLIFAPQSGEATRAQLGEQGVILRDRSAGLPGQLRERATNALSQGREMYTRTKGELTDTYMKAKSGEA